jgi:hypothetical protein
MRYLGAVLDHERPLAPFCERSSAVVSQDISAGLAPCVGAMCAGRSAFQSSRAPRGRIDRPCSLLRLILRGVRQRAFVILDPNQIARVDPAVARLSSEIMLGFGDAPPVGALAVGMGPLGFHRDIARGAVKDNAVHGFENHKAFGNAIHLYIERAIHL